MPQVPLTVEIVVTIAWWLAPCLYLLWFWYLVTGYDPDFVKVGRVLDRAIKVKLCRRAKPT